ncbi:MAG: L-serine ammonia-lyase, iron-sulfur-dependent, subunit alpha [Deltaproteobacteria bacterium]|nr:L-serine ammonia-lyase, iron-sulfur-dependent, subunit alpha [Deltaproteobacteria bacterium]
MNDPMSHDLLIVLKKELIEAMGCTEPAAAALAGATAVQALRKEFALEPERISVAASRDIIKNAMSVGLPNSSLRGIKAAVVLGAMSGNPQDGLAVLARVTPDVEARARVILEEEKVDLALREEVPAIFIEVAALAGGHEAIATIAHFHDRLESLRIDGVERLRLPSEEMVAPSGMPAIFPNGYPSFSQMIAFADTVDPEAISFLLDAAVINMRLSDPSLDDHGIDAGRESLTFAGNRSAVIDALHVATAKASSASNARMTGSSLPVVINSGSGNQGITATVPVAVLAEKMGASREALARALALSSSVAITIAARKGRLSSLCGAFTAAIGTACGFVRLLGGGSYEINSAVNNMVGNLTGIICDGAKGTCALKIDSAVHAAALSAVMAMDGKGAPSDAGIVGTDADDSIDHLERIVCEGMDMTDRTILDIMLTK